MEMTAFRAAAFFRRLLFHSLHFTAAFFLYFIDPHRAYLLPAIIHTHAEPRGRDQVDEYHENGKQLAHIMQNKEILLKNGMILIWGAYWG
jgi:hypothetical protein